jgi:hypothetical protein
VTKLSWTTILASLVVGLATLGCGEARRPEAGAHPREVAGDSAPAANGGSGSAAVPDASALRDAGRATIDDDAGIVADAGGHFESAVAACLAELWSACPQTGACHSSNSDDAGVSIECYASGVTSATAVQNEQCKSGRFATYTSEVRSADGTLCYTAVGKLDCTMAEESGATTWTDRNGNTVAVVSFTFSTRTLSCSKSGEKQTCKQPCSVPAQPSTSCERGTCP